MKRSMLLAMLAAAFAAASAAAPLLTLDPLNGAVSGTPGSTTGWGFTLTNDTGFLVPSLVVFCEGPFNPGCTPTFGTFTDFAAQLQFNVVGATPLVQPFDNAAQTGIGSFTINLNAPTGITTFGNIFMVYDTFSCDLNDPGCNPVQTGFSELLSAPASVTIVPEPALGYLLGGLTLFAIRVRPRRN